MPQLALKHAISDQTHDEARDYVVHVSRPVLRTIRHCFAVMVASRSSITSRRFLSQAGRSGCGGKLSAWRNASADLAYSFCS